MVSFGNSKSKHIDAQPYEAPINVRQIANLPYGSDGNMADYFEPMSHSAEGALPLSVVFYDNPYEGSRNDVMPLAMEMARRGVAVYTIGLSKGDGAFFWRQVNDVFTFLTDLAVDRHGFGLHCQTYSHEGNVVSLVGCGTGATLAAFCLRAFFNARMREYIAPHCPAVKAFFNMGSTPSVDFADLIRIGAFVSISGRLCISMDANIHAYDRWLGRGFDKTLLCSYLDCTRWVSADYPPILLVTSQADATRPQALAVQAALPAAVACRLIDSPRQDEQEHILEEMFSARSPLWESSKEVNTFISTFVKVCEN
jgi:hypothetical protein